MGCVARFGMRPWTSTAVQRMTRAPHPPAVRRRLLNAVLRTGSEWRLHCWGGCWPEEEGDMVHGLNRRRMESRLWQAFKGAWAGQEPGCLNFSKTSLDCVRMALAQVVTLVGGGFWRWWLRTEPAFSSRWAAPPGLPPEPLSSPLSRPPMTEAGAGHSLGMWASASAPAWFGHCCSYPSALPAPCGRPLTQRGCLNFGVFLSLVYIFPDYTQLSRLHVTLCFI